MFSLEQLLFAIANDQRSNIESVTKIIPMLMKVYEIEKADRQALKVCVREARKRDNVTKCLFLGCWSDCI